MQEVRPIAENGDAAALVGCQQMAQINGCPGHASPSRPGAKIETVGAPRIAAVYVGLDGHMRFGESADYRQHPGGQVVALGTLFDQKHILWRLTRRAEAHARIACGADGRLQSSRNVE